MVAVTLLGVVEAFQVDSYSAMNVGGVLVKTVLLSLHHTPSKNPAPKLAGGVPAPGMRYNNADPS
jgi:hypothetical protein